jgi:hypothetical protein
MEITKQILSMILPAQWLDNFEVAEIKEKRKEWNITLIEKEDCIPKALEGKDVVLNGYLNPAQVHDFPIRGKACYLNFIRRRYKIRGTDESYHNEYDFHPKGMKATYDFGNFLKGFNRDEANQLFSDW